MIIVRCGWTRGIVGSGQHFDERTTRIADADARRGAAASANRRRRRVDGRVSRILLRHPNSCNTVPFVTFNKPSHHTYITSHDRRRRDRFASFCRTRLQQHGCSPSKNDCFFPSVSCGLSTELGPYTESKGWIKDPLAHRTNRSGEKEGLEGAENGGRPPPPSSQPNLHVSQLKK